MIVTGLTASRLVVAVLASALLAPLTAQAAAQPHVRTAKESPHAGHTFVGVVMTVPNDVRVVKLFCKATIGGHFKRTSTGGSVYIGGTYIKPIIKRSYVLGRLTRATCEWTIPATAAGKLLSLAQPGCMMDCWNWGFVVSFLDLTRRPGAGRSQTIYRYGPTWPIRA
jgi:hypothetical protein